MHTARRFVLAAAFACALAAPAMSLAASQCRNSSGKFIKCPTQAASISTAARCKDAKGKFISCSKPGAVPITPSVASNGASANVKPAKSASLTPAKPTKTAVNPATKTP